MIGTETLNKVIGADVFDADGDKIGTASEVYLDDQSGNPEWLTVKTGLFGSKESFIPIAQADLTDGGVQVPVSKSKVKDAPKIDTDGHLSPEEEQQLYRYYGLEDGAAGNQLADTTVGRVDDAQERMSGQGGRAEKTQGTAMQGTNAHGTKGRDTSGPTTDDAMTLSEERLTVGTQRVETGKARLRKHIITENVTQTVPVSHEEVTIEREPITDANRGDALDGPALSEEEHEVTLHAEQPVVSKDTVAVERVRLGTQTVTEQQQVTDSVRKEQLDTDGGVDQR